MKDKLIIIILFFILIEIFINKIIISTTILYSLNTWVNSIIPSMFPFFLVSDILINYDISKYIPSFIKDIFKYLFNCNDYVISVFFLSIISGFPNSARMINSLYKDNYIDIDSANRALLFCYFSNPLFILSTVGVFFLHNERYGIIILISHYIGNFIIGIMTRNYTIISNIDYTKNISKSQRFSTVLVNAIRNTINSLLMILGSITIFLIISSIIINRFNFDIYTSSIIKGILEITMGLESISCINIMDIYKIVISSMFISFGGFSVHLQIISQLDYDYGDYSRFFLYRVIHALIAGLVSYILLI